MSTPKKSRDDNLSSRCYLFRLHDPSLQNTDSALTHEELVHLQNKIDATALRHESLLHTTVFLPEPLLLVQENGDRLFILPLIFGERSHFYVHCECLKEWECLDARFGLQQASPPHPAQSLHNNFACAAPLSLLQTASQVNSPIAAVARLCVVLSNARFLLPCS